MLAALELFVRWRRPLLSLLALAALVGGYFWWEGKIEARVRTEVTAEWAAKEKAISAAAEAAYTKKLEAALARQKALAEEDAKLAAQSAKWEKDHELTLEKHTAAVLSGVERLRVEVRYPASEVAGSAEGDTAATAHHAEPAKTADIMPEVAAAILRIAGDSAGDVQAFNDLLAHYRTIEAACR